MKTRLLIVLGYVGTILLGAFLLALPVSSPSHTWMKPMDALFTACSAVCVTGLSVIEVGTALSRFGQSVLLALVQIGAIGIMTTCTFFLVLAGRRLSLSSEFELQSAIGAKSIRGIRGLILWVVCSMFVLEAVGTVILHGRFAADAAVRAGSAVAGTSPWFRACFYSVMSFCNAGFSIDPGSLAVFQGQPCVLLTMGALALLGGVGFLVIYDLCTIRFWRRNLVKRGHLSLHTRVVLLFTFVALVGMFVFFVALEWNHALEPFSLAEKLAVGFFQSVTPRTCGFTVVPLHEAQPASRFMTEVLMFIGAAPGGTGGGIKVTTLAVFTAALLAICRGQRDCVLFRRSIPEAVVRESIVIVMVFAAVIAVGMTVLLISEAGNPDLPFENLLFETVSAISTTGLSCGNTTASLSTVGRIVLMVCMFGGRLGPLAIVLLIVGQEERTTIHYPKEQIIVG
ncbi:MAG: potassium transporter TrkG [Kiritimatiellia bacterium]